MRTGQAGNGMFVRDGNTFFAGYKPVRQYGWGILVESRRLFYSKAFLLWNNAYGSLRWCFLLSA